MKFPVIAAGALAAIAGVAAAQPLPTAPPRAAAPVAAAPAAADWRTPDPQNVLVIDTSKGRIIAELTPEAAPAHVERVRALARRKFYDGLEFFRVIDDFMAQTGDPENAGTGGSDLPDLTAEFSFRRAPTAPGFVMTPNAAAVLAGNPARGAYGFVDTLPVESQVKRLVTSTIPPTSMLPGAGELGLMAMSQADGKVNGWGLFCPGVLGAARATDPNSANSQFFLMRAQYPTLDHTYTAFGRVLSGLDVVRAIKAGEPVAPPRDVMQTVQVLADMPANARPSVRVVDTRGAWFKAEVERVRAARGDSYTPCDVNIPVEIR